MAKKKLQKRFINQHLSGDGRHVYHPDFYSDAYLITGNYKDRILSCAKPIKLSIIRQMISTFEWSGWSLHYSPSTTSWCILEWAHLKGKEISINIQDEGYITIELIEGRKNV